MPSTIAPVLDSLADDLDGQVIIAKVDVDRNPETARELGIRSIPSLYVFKDGKKVAQRIGTASYNELKALVAKPDAERTVREVTLGTAN